MGKEDFVDTDFLLIMKMKQGNEQAFDEFVHRYYEEILKYCRYHYKGKTKNYLYTIAGNLCKNFYKKKNDIPTEGEKLESESYFRECKLSEIAGIQHHLFPVLALYIIGRMR